MKFANPDIQFELDGKTRTLRFSAKALAALQDEWGMENLDQVAVKLAQLESNGLTVKDAAAMLWAGFRTHHPEVTVDQAFDLLDDMGLANFEALLGQAIQAAASEGGGTAPANPPRAKSGSRGR